MTKKSPKTPSPILADPKGRPHDIRKGVCETCKRSGPELTMSACPGYVTAGDVGGSKGVFGHKPPTPSAPRKAPTFVASAKPANVPPVTKATKADLRAAAAEELRKHQDALEASYEKSKAKAKSPKTAVDKVVEADRKSKAPAAAPVAPLDKKQVAAIQAEFKEIRKTESACGAIRVMAKSHSAQELISALDFMNPSTIKIQWKAGAK